MKTRRRGRQITLLTGVCVLVIGLALIVWYRDTFRSGVIHALGELRAAAG